METDTASQCGAVSRRRFVGAGLLAKPCIVTMPDPPDIETTLNTARRNLRDHGVRVRRPRSVEIQYFVSPELSHALQTQDELDMVELVQADNSVDHIDTALGTYDTRTDRINLNLGHIKVSVMIVCALPYIDEIDLSMADDLPDDFYEVQTRDALRGVLTEGALDEWEHVRGMAMSYDLDPHFDINIFALMYDLIHHDTDNYDPVIPVTPEQLESVYHEQLVAVLEHELIHKDQTQRGIPPHIGEIVTTIWSVERSPIYRLLDEATEEDLSVEELVLESMQLYEEFGYHGIAADATEFVRAYDRYRGSDRRKLRRLISLQNEFTPRAQSDSGGLLRPIVKGVVLGAAIGVVLG